MNSLISIITSAIITKNAEKHSAAALNKRILGICGLTLSQAWSPWSNALQRRFQTNATIQTYGNITLFQTDMPCVACGKAGCDDRYSKSNCFYAIEPEAIFNEAKNG